MATGNIPQQRHSNAYNIFILVLTVLSLAIMVAMLLPVSDQTLNLLMVYDKHHIDQLVRFGDFNNFPVKEVSILDCHKILSHR